MQQRPCANDFAVCISVCLKSQTRCKFKVEKISGLIYSKRLKSLGKQSLKNLRYCYITGFFALSMIANRIQVVEMRPGFSKCPVIFVSEQ